MDMIGKIRRLHSRGKKSERETSRTTGLSRDTVAISNFTVWPNIMRSERPTASLSPDPTQATTAPRKLLAGSRYHETFDGARRCDS